MLLWRSTNTNPASSPPAEEREPSVLQESISFLSRYDLEGVRRRIYFVLEPSASRAGPKSLVNASRVAGAIIAVTIVISCAIFCIDSLPAFQDDSEPSKKLFIVECIVSSIFTAEFILRFFCCPSRKAFLLYPLNLLDVVSLVPFYVEVVSRVAEVSPKVSVLVMLRVARVARVLRILKLSKYSGNLQIVFRTLSASRDAFILLVILVSLCLIFFSAALYIAELSIATFDDSANMWRYTDDRDAVYPFQSIPHALWWTMVTMTTVGYGDQVPRSPAGKLVAASCMLTGIGVLATFTILLNSNFATIRKDFTTQASDKELRTPVPEKDRRKDRPLIVPRPRWAVFLNVITDLSELPRTKTEVVLQSLFNALSASLVVISICTMFAGTMPEYAAQKRAGNTNVHLERIEYVLVTCFTLEFLLRMVVAPGIFAFFRQGMTWVDVISILPQYVEYLLRLSNLSAGTLNALFVFRVLRIVRALRTLRVFKNHQGLKIVVGGLARSMDALVLMLFLVSIELLFFGSAMYFVETASCSRNADRVWVDEFGQRCAFQSIPESFWWAIVTTCTVGYGDTIPRTVGGKLVAGACMLCGTMILVFPISILGSACEEYGRLLSEQKCGTLYLSIKCEHFGIVDSDDASLILHRDSINSDGSVYVFIHHAVGLRNGQKFGLSDPYCVVAVGSQVAQTETVFDSLDPDFSTSFEFPAVKTQISTEHPYHLTTKERLKIVIIDKTSAKEMGQALLSLESFRQNIFTDIEVNLVKQFKGGYARGGTQGVAEHLTPYVVLLETSISSHMSRRNIKAGIPSASLTSSSSRDMIQHLEVECLESGSISTIDGASNPLSIKLAPPDRKSMSSLFSRMAAETKACSKTEVKLPDTYAFLCNICGIEPLESVRYSLSSDCIRMLDFGNAELRDMRQTATVVFLISYLSDLRFIGFAKQPLDDGLLYYLMANVSTHNEIRGIDLCATSITNKGGEYILKAVKANPHLVHVDVSHTELAVSVRDEIAARVRENYEEVPDAESRQPSISSSGGGWSIGSLICTFEESPVKQNSEHSSNGRSPSTPIASRAL